MQVSVIVVSEEPSEHITNAHFEQCITDTNRSQIYCQFTTFIHGIWVVHLKKHSLQGIAKQ